MFSSLQPAGAPSPPTSPRRRGTAGPLALGLVLVVGAALGRVFVGTDALRLGYALSEQQARHRELVGRERALQAELAAAVAPARLAALGRRWQLGPPTPQQIVSPAPRPGRAATP